MLGLTLEEFDRPEVIEQKNGDVVLNGQNKNLEYLVEETIEECVQKKVTKISLKENFLSKLPEDFGRLKYVTRLGLARNEFSLFPSPICEMKKLNYLNISDNALQQLPDEIRQLSKLKTLDLNRNKFEKFPMAIVEDEGLPYLKELLLEENKIQEIPESIEVLKSLAKLEISANKIEDLPLELIALKELVKLDVSNNQIKICSPLFVNKMNAGIRLDLTDNPLEYPPSEVCEQGLDDIREYVRRYPRRDSRNRLVEVDRSLLVDSERRRVNSGRKASGSSSDESYSSESRPTPSPSPRGNGKANKIRKKLLMDIDENENIGKNMVLSNGYHNYPNCYKMARKPRGVALIFSNETFAGEATDACTELITREGTQIDAENLHSLFKELDFNVRCYQNLRADQMEDALKVTALEDHSHFDCLIVCVLSHGVLGKVFGVDKKTMEIKAMTEKFTPSECPTLGNKPKLFFIQACQGGNYQLGHPHLQMDGEQDYPTIPNEADFLLGESTVPGYVAYRDVAEGSWYITELVTAIRKHHRHMHLLDILTIVNDEVAKKAEGIHKQIPSPRHTLRRNVYLS